MRIDRRAATGLGSLAAVIVLTLVAWLGSSGDGSDGGPDARPGSAADRTVTSSTVPTSDPGSGLATVSASDLPQEARELLTLIDEGGPFPSGDRDGVVFENREGLLPEHDRGYYHEYTARTPGEDDRGARRIIAGDGGELYWTADHYQSFRRIVRS